MFLSHYLAPQRAASCTAIAICGLRTSRDGFFSKVPFRNTAFTNSTFTKQVYRRKSSIFTSRESSAVLQPAASRAHSQTDPLKVRRSYARRAANFAGYSVILVLSLGIGTFLGFKIRRKFIMVQQDTPMESTLNLDSSVSEQQQTYSDLVELKDIPKWTPSTENQRKIEEQLMNLPQVRALLANDKLLKARPHLLLEEADKVHNLTAGIISGDGKLTVPPIIFVDTENNSIESFGHLGTSLCGHPSVVHGGCIATLMDEALATCVRVMCKR